MRKAVCVLLAALLVGCTRAPAPAPPPPPAPTPAPAVEPPAAPVNQATALFPPQDTALAYGVRDRSATADVAVQEHLLIAGQRAVAVTDGKAYAVWEFRPDGVWRADPKGSGVLLRYLPPQLTDGQLWHQKSGNAEVWFRLSKTGPCTPNTQTCWDLTVLNRGERTVFRFAEGRGPVSASADNWAEPARSFDKYLSDQGVPPAPMPVAARQLLLSGLPAAPAPAPVAEGTPEQWEEAVYQMLKAARTDLTVLRLDLNGDGRQDLVRGHFGQWISTTLDFFRADGSRAAYPASGAVEQRVEQLRFKGMRLPAFLVQSKPNGEPNGVTIMAAQENQYDKTWSMEAVYGWAPKSYGAPADRVRWTEDGTITIEWDMKDPARHTRVTSYTWISTPERSNVKLETLTYRPEGKELVYPATPKGVLEAAFVARWLDLQSELPRYFASPQAAAAFVADKRVSRPDYGPGTVQIGKVTPPEQLIACGATVIEAEPKGPGPHSFAAKWGGYEWCQGVWGTVTFGTDPQGRPVIQDLKLEGTASNSL